MREFFRQGRIIPRAYQADHCKRPAQRSANAHSPTKGCHLAINRHRPKRDAEQRANQQTEPQIRAARLDSEVRIIPTYRAQPSAPKPERQ